jgi:hypothetical protein
VSDDFKHIRNAVTVRARSWNGTVRDFDSWPAARAWAIEHLHGWTQRGDYIKSWPDLKGGQNFGMFTNGKITVATVHLKEE